MWQLSGVPGTWWILNKLYWVNNNRIRVLNTYYNIPETLQSALCGLTHLVIKITL